MELGGAYGAREAPAPLPPSSREAPDIWRQELLRAMRILDTSFEDCFDRCAAAHTKHT